MGIGTKKSCQGFNRADETNNIFYNRWLRKGGISTGDFACQKNVNLANFCTKPDRLTIFDIAFFRLRENLLSI
jgi:hypothetical protein